MQKIALKTFTLISLVLVFGLSVAGQRHCSRSDAMNADDSVTSLKSWADVYAAYRKYGHCDDGAISEGYTDSMVHLLSSEWTSTPELLTLAAKDRKFRSFVLNHIDASASTDELRKISTLTASQCPKGGTDLCHALHSKANVVVKEIESAVSKQ